MAAWRILSLAACLDFSVASVPCRENCPAGIEASSLVQVRHKSRSLNRSICPGSNGSTCSKQTCCPGLPQSGGLTFPCPLSPFYDLCEAKPPWNIIPDFFYVPQYHEATALAFAEVAQASYCGPSAELRNFTCTLCKAAKPSWDIELGSVRFVDLKDKFENDAIFMYVAKVSMHDTSGDYGADCVLAIRGSSNVANWARDVEFPHERFKDVNGSCPDCYAEHGFYEVWEKASERVVSSLESLGCKANTKTNRLYVTGHSLGGAVAALGMFSLADLGYEVTQSFLLEPPLPGNNAFASFFGDRFPNAFRLTHGKDVVVHVPMWYLEPLTGGYSTFGTEVFYYPTGDDYKVCEGLWDRECSYQYDALVTPESIDDHCSVPYAIGGNICTCIL